MLYEISRAHRPDIIAIAEPKILIKDLKPRFWRSMNMAFLDENSRGNGLRPNIWIAYSRLLSTLLVVVVKTNQLMVISLSSARGDLFLGFIHAASTYFIMGQISLFKQS